MSHLIQDDGDKQAVKKEHTYFRNSVKREVDQ